MRLTKALDRATVVPKICTCQSDQNPPGSSATTYRHDRGGPPFEPEYALGMQSVRTEAGKPLRLVHGTSNLHNWDLVVPALARERTVIAIDLPGFGEAHL